MLHGAIQGVFQHRAQVCPRPWMVSLVRGEERLRLRRGELLCDRRVTVGTERHVAPGVGLQVPVPLRGGAESAGDDERVRGGPGDHLEAHPAGQA